MAKKTMLEAVADWKPDPDDPYGEDKRVFLDFLEKHAVGSDNPVSIKRVAAKARFSRKYSREGVQQQLMVPLRTEGRIFVGTGSKGIYLIDSPEDGDNTINFYSTRIRSELRHLRNLKSLASRHNLFSRYTSSKRKGPKGFLYFDESGTPSLKDAATAPHFIVCGVLLENASALRSIDKRFDLIAEILGKPAGYPFCQYQ